MVTYHAQARMQQRGIPPLIEQWLDEFGEEQYDGRGGIRRYFTRRSIRAMERAFGRQPIRQLSRYFNAYIVESTDGVVITVGRRFRRINRT